MTHTLILIEDVKDLEKAIKYKKNNETKIICFNFHVYRKLKKMNIKHELIENYLDNSNRELIDEIIMKISSSWYKNENLAKLLMYNNVNLGSLLELEIFPFFVHLIKNFISITELIKKEEPKTIIANNFLWAMAKQIMDDKKINLMEYTKTSKKLVFDVIEISFNLGRGTYSIHIPRKFIIVIKNVFEYIIDSVISTKKMYKNAIIFLDFNPVSYQDLMIEFSKSNMDIFLLNLRKPSISSIKSFNIIRKYNLKILRPKQFHNSKLSFTIRENQKKIKKEIFNVFSSNYFDSIFTINNKNIWPAIRNDFKLICSNRFTEAISHIELINEMLKNMKVKSIIVLNNTGYEEKILLSVAKRYNIKGFVLQHGIFPENDYSLKYIDILSLIPPVGFKAAVWGDSLKKHLLKLGVSSDDVVSVGSPRHEGYFRDKQQIGNSGILICITPSNETDFDSTDTRNYIKAEQMLQEIFQIVNEKSKKITVKIHPSQHDPLEVASIVNDIDPNTPIYKNGNIFEFIKNCEILVCFEFSTVLLEAMILNKPTIFYPIHPKWGIEDNIFISGAVILVKTREQFENALTKLLTDQEFKRMQIKKGSDFINSYITKQEESSSYFRELLEK